MAGPAAPPDDDSPPWERPGVTRRDCEPHRGRLLRVLASAACVLAVLSCATFVPAFVALALGAWTWAAARRDRAEMHAGRMDGSGEPQARGAEATAAAAVAISATVLTGGGLLLLDWLFLVR